MLKGVRLLSTPPTAVESGIAACAYCEHGTPSEINNGEEKQCSKPHH